ncbi:hypothetical protein scyTo_0018040 [Scyliorhinus torazame]|uniref:Uncharacterized protein n=1 Tax=Scyliorhinus torazame TaxID=75743 RepID=A0A401Q4B8_SCYTO|nr:hypothetical protein [Scyliorhinus torazame]
MFKVKPAIGFKRKSGRGFNGKPAAAFKIKPEMPDSDFTGRALEVRQKCQSGKVKHKQDASEEDKRNFEKLPEKSDKPKGTYLEHTKRNNRGRILRSAFVNLEVNFLEVSYRLEVSPFQTPT